MRLRIKNPSRGAAVGSSSCSRRPRIPVSGYGRSRSEWPVHHHRFARGSYYLVALEAMERGRARDPEFLERLGAKPRLSRCRRTRHRWSTFVSRRVSKSVGGRRVDNSRHVVGSVGRRVDVSGAARRANSRSRTRSIARVRALPERVRIVRVPTTYEPSNCRLAALATEWAWNADLAVGVQNPEACLGLGIDEQLAPEGSGIQMEAKEALRYLVARTPGYTMRELDGVLVIRRNDAWNDAGNVLHATVPAFSATGVGPDEILFRVLDLGPRPQRPGGPVLDFVFRGGSRLDLLDAILVAYGRAGSTWTVAPGGAGDLRISVIVPGLSFAVHWQPS
jgi:hypothetical protein